MISINRKKVKRFFVREWVILLVVIAIIVVGATITYYLINQVDKETAKIDKELSAFELYNVELYKKKFNDVVNLNGRYISEEDFTNKMINDSVYSHKFWESIGGNKIYGSWFGFIEAFKVSELKYADYLIVKEMMEGNIEDKVTIEDISLVSLYILLIIVYPLRLAIFITRKAIKTIKSK